MFIIKENVNLIFNGKSQREVASKIGITEFTLSKILNRKQSCSKMAAYCITKCNDENAEILDYFEYVDKEK